MDASRSISWLSSLKLFREFRQLKDVAATLIALLFFQLAWSLYFQYIPHFIASVGYPQFVTRFLTTVGFGMAFSFCCLTRLFQGKFNSRTLALFATAAVAIGIIGQVITRDQSLMLCGLGLFSAMGYGLGYSALMAILSQSVDAARQGLIMGLAGSLSAVSAVITAVAGAILVNVNSLATFITASLCMLICLSTLMFGKEILPISMSRNTGE